MSAPIPVKSFLFEENKLVVKKHYNLYLGLVTPSSGWWSPIAQNNVNNLAGEQLWFGVIELEKQDPWFATYPGKKVKNSLYSFYLQ